jgi:peptidoglycan/LPS O-acetylase OafA/YrhL
VVTAFFFLLGATGVPLGTRPAMVVAVFAYVSNWYLLAAAHGGPIPWGALGHTWSLAIEEQFYLLWPPVVWALARLRRAAMLPGVSALALAFLVWSLESGRPALATDVSAWCLLCGCALAAYVRSRHPRSVPAWPAAAVLLVLPFVSSSLAMAAHVVTPLLTAVTVWVAWHRPVGWLEVRWLRWLGVRSYGLYLWHFPVASLALAMTGPWAIKAAAGISVSVGLAALSWRYVEAPLLTDGRFRALRARLVAVPRRRTQLVPIRSRRSRPHDSDWARAS